MTKLKPENQKDIYFLAETIGYYLSETYEEMDAWDCEHLAMNLLNDLEIISPKWRKDNKNVRQSKIRD